MLAWTSVSSSRTRTAPWPTQAIVQVRSDSFREPASRFHRKGGAAIQGSLGAEGLEHPSAQPVGGLLRDVVEPHGHQPLRAADGMPGDLAVQVQDDLVERETDRQMCAGV